MGWPRPGSASRRTPRRARSCTGCGATTGCSTPPPWPTALRWQLDGWLTGTGRASALNGRLPARPTAGIDRLRLIPDGLVRYAGMQPGLWGELGVADERAHRAMVRVQGLLGPDSVFTAVLGGGRGYADRVRRVLRGAAAVHETIAESARFDQDRPLGFDEARRRECGCVVLAVGLDGGDAGVQTPALTDHLEEGRVQGLVAAHPKALMPRSPRTSPSAYGERVDP